MRQTVVGLFTLDADARSAMQLLNAKGIDPIRIIQGHHAMVRWSSVAHGLGAP